MTDRAYQAKEWLMRFDELEAKRKRCKERVMLLDSKVNNCVITSYEIRGGKDNDTARARHEDLLLEYSTACGELERITAQVIHEDLITIKAISRLKNIKYRIILYARYLNHMSIKQIEKEKMLDLKKTQLYKLEQSALDAFGAILEQDNTEIIPNPERKTGERLEINQTA